MPSTIGITVPQANDVTVDLAVFLPDGVTGADLTGLTPVMIIKASQHTDDGHGAPYDELTIGAGLTWADQAAGTLTADLSHVVLANAGLFWYRLDVIDGSGDRTTAIDGFLRVQPV